MIEKIILNNIVSIVIHTVFCFITILLFAIAKRFSSNIAIYIPLAITIPLLYIMCGRLFLFNTYNTKNNVLSVAVLAAILITSVAISSRFFNLQITNISFAPLSLFTVRFLPDILGALVYAMFPSVFLYIGIILKRAS